MAWLSVANSHEDLIRQLVENGVLQEGKLLDAFCATDRGDFVEEEDRTQAYADRPFKKGSIHISAPHMYATVLDALDLSKGKSFLNIGSGSGYLSCLAAYLLGEEGVSHGVEISEAACNFSRDRARRWYAKLLRSLQERADEDNSANPLSVISEDGISFINANCFDIDILSAVSTMKYDRIYVGGGCPDSRKEFFLSMLADDGILVAPINEKNQMLSIKKFYGRVYSMKAISNVNFAPLVDTSERADEADIIAQLAERAGGSVLDLQGDIEVSVRRVQAAPASASYIIHPLHPGQNPTSPFSTALHLHQSYLSTTTSSNNIARVRLPSLVWMPTHRRHLQFPPEFRRSIMEVLLANNRLQTSTSTATAVSNCRRGITTCSGYQCCHAPVPSFLPHHIWLYIFTFASREWFQPVKSDLQSVSLELSVERRLRSSAEDRLRRTEEQLRQLQRENRTYQVILSRLHQHRRAPAVSSGVTGSALMEMLHNEDLDMEEEGEGMDEEEEEDDEDEWEDTEEEGDGEWMDAQSDVEEDLLEEEEEIEGEEVEIDEESVAADAEDLSESSPQPMDVNPATPTSLSVLVPLPQQHAVISSPVTLSENNSNSGVWAEVESEHEEYPLSQTSTATSRGAGDGAAEGIGMAGLSSYNTYLQIIRSQEQHSVSSAAASCIVSSYNSAMTGTTVETKGSSSEGTAEPSRASSGERMSDFSADGADAAYWNNINRDVLSEQADEVGDDGDGDGDEGEKANEGETAQNIEPRVSELYFDDSDL